MFTCDRSLAWCIVFWILNRNFCPTGYWICVNKIEGVWQLLVGAVFNLDNWQHWFMPWNYCHSWRRHGFPYKRVSIYSSNLLASFPSIFDFCQLIIRILDFQFSRPSKLFSICCVYMYSLMIQRMSNHGLLWMFLYLFKFSTLIFPSEIWVPCIIVYI